MNDEQLNIEPEDEEVEGHKKIFVREDDDEDVEGHKKIFVREDDDDVEGHRLAAVNGRVSPRDDDDDVEGHRTSQNTRG